MDEKIVEVSGLIGEKGKVRKRCFCKQSLIYLPSPVNFPSKVGITVQMS